MCKIDDNNAIMYGGIVHYGSSDRNNNEIWNYNFTDKIWSKLNPKKNLPEISEHSIEKLNDSMIIVCGGYIGSIHDIDASFMFNIFQNNWSIFSSKNPPKYVDDPQLICLDDGKLFLIKGLQVLIM